MANVKKEVKHIPVFMELSDDGSSVFVYVGAKSPIRVRREVEGAVLYYDEHEKLVEVEIFL